MEVNVRNCVCLVFYFLLVQQFSETGSELGDREIVECIPHQALTVAILEDFSKLQVITDFDRKPLREIADEDTVDETKELYNSYLSCTWSKHHYQSDSGDINFYKIEQSLGDALIRAVKGTNSDVKALKIQAKNMIDDCKSKDEYATDVRLVQLQNCILAQIKKLVYFSDNATVSSL